MEEFNSFRWLRFTASTAVRPEGCEENLYLGDIWSQVGQWFQRSLWFSSVFQLTGPRTASLKVSGGQCRTSPGGGISMERGGWSGLLLTKPGTELRSLAMWRWALGSEPEGGGSRVCKNHLLGCLSCAGPWLWRQCYPSGCASLTGVTLRRGERTTVAGNRIEKVPAPSPPPPLTFWSTRHQTP